jgi:hypothetical protein
LEKPWRRKPLYGGSQRKTNPAGHLHVQRKGKKRGIKSTIRLKGRLYQEWIIPKETVE